MSEFEDKRYFPRATVSLEGHIHDSGKRLAVDIVDLTVQGISFKSEHALPVGGSITIDVDGSEDVRSNELKAEILRSDPLSNVTPLKYIVAAKFIEVNDEYLMDALALVHGKKPKS